MLTFVEKKFTFVKKSLLIKKCFHLLKKSLHLFKNMGKIEKANRENCENKVTANKSKKQTTTTIKNRYTAINLMCK